MKDWDLTFNCMLSVTLANQHPVSFSGSDWSPEFIQAWSLQGLSVVIVIIIWRPLVISYLQCTKHCANTLFWSLFHSPCTAFLQRKSCWRKGENVIALVAVVRLFWRRGLLFYGKMLWWMFSTENKSVPGLGHQSLLRLERIGKCFSPWENRNSRASSEEEGWEEIKNREKWVNLPMGTDFTACPQA